MFDDFLGISYCKRGESDEALVEKGERAANAFDEELLRMGIYKQHVKETPTA